MTVSRSNFHVLCGCELWAISPVVFSWDVAVIIDSSTDYAIQNNQDVLNHDLPLSTAFVHDYWGRSSRDLPVRVALVTWRVVLAAP
jgi:hypothetical protein